MQSYIFIVNYELQIMNYFVTLHVKLQDILKMQTICANSTSAGGAIAIIRVSGDDAISIVNKVFISQNNQPLTATAGYTLHFGRIIDGEDIVDEVLVSIFRAPHSYTGEDSAEISCHGSSYIVHTILSLLINYGCQMAQPGEFTQRAYLNGKMDLSQAEAVADLISSSTQASHRLAMSQMRGGYSNTMRHLRDQLLEMTSLLELEIDFSEEDVEFADRQQLLALAQNIHDVITHLASTFRAGNALKNGIPVAIVGAPNVGKSTLLNQLLHDDRAIVSEIQGTTRDLVEDSITIGGTLFRFIDTAGIRHTTDTVERMGIERSMRAVQNAQIIIMLAEPGVPYPDITTTDDQIVIRIKNKTPSFQAINATGLDRLESQLVEAALTLTHTDSDIIVTNLRHQTALLSAQQSIATVIHQLHDSTTPDIIALDLHACIDSLSEILGDLTSDNTLHNIFSKFCVGK